MPEKAIARLTVGVSSVWRAYEVVETLAAIDSLCSHIAVVMDVSDQFEEFNYVISNLQVMGLLQKGPPSEWDRPRTPSDAITRKDYADFTERLRGSGVEAKHIDVGLSFAFTVDNLMDLVPKSARPEIERIQMSSPGEWALLLAGKLATTKCLQFLERMIGTILFLPEAQRERAAVARKVEAQADQEDARARKMHAEADLADLSVERERLKFLQDSTVAVDSILTQFRTAGFLPTQLKTLVEQPIYGSMEALARRALRGQIRSLSIDRPKPNVKQKPNRKGGSRKRANI
jgi:hypothetical protein